MPVTIIVEPTVNGAVACVANVSVAVPEELDAPVVVKEAVAFCTLLFVLDKT